MVARTRISPQEIFEDTPESSVASGASTPTLDGRATPAGTVYSDNINASDPNLSPAHDPRVQFSAGTSGYSINEPITRPLTEYKENGKNKQYLTGQSGPGPIVDSKAVRDIHGYILVAMLALSIISTVTMALWITWFQRDNVISFNGHRGNEDAPRYTYTASAISTITETVHVPMIQTIEHTVTRSHMSTKPMTIIETQTQTVTKTRISTTTVRVTKTSISTTTVRVTKTRNERTSTKWGGGSSSIVKCYHGNSPTGYHNFFSYHKKQERQEALWSCLENGKNGIRWTGVKCGGALWEVEVDPSMGGIYSDSKKCWRRCEWCLSGAIEKLLKEAECVVEDRGSRCVARYAEL